MIVDAVKILNWPVITTQKDTSDGRRSAQDVKEMHYLPPLFCGYGPAQH